MPLTRETVRHIALLARLELSEQEEEQFTEQLGHILGHFEKLAGLDTGTVEPTATVVDMAAAYRDDVVSNPPAAECSPARFCDQDDAFRNGRTDSSV